MLYMPHYCIVAPALRGIEALVLRRAAEEQGKRRFFLPSRLVQLVQLTMLCNRAVERVIPMPIDPESTGPLSPALNVLARPAALESQPVQGVCVGGLVYAAQIEVPRRERLPGWCLFLRVSSSFVCMGGWAGGRGVQFA